MARTAAHPRRWVLRTACTIRRPCGRHRSLDPRCAVHSGTSGNSSRSPPAPAVRTGCRARPADDAACACGSCAGPAVSWHGHCGRHIWSPHRGLSRIGPGRAGVAAPRRLRTTDDPARADAGRTGRISPVQCVHPHAGGRAGIRSCGPQGPGHARCLRPCVAGRGFARQHGVFQDTPRTGCGRVGAGDCRSEGKAHLPCAVRFAADGVLGHWRVACGGRGTARAVSPGQVDERRRRAGRRRRENALRVYRGKRCRRRT